MNEVDRAEEKRLTAAYVEKQRRIDELARPAQVLSGGSELQPADVLDQAAEDEADRRRKERDAAYTELQAWRRQHS